MHEAKQVQNISVLGAGAWGTAVAIALAARHDVLLWGRNPAQMARSAAARDNTDYLPGFPFPERLRVSADFEAAIAHVTELPAAGSAEATPLLIAACPVAGLRPLLQSLKGRPIPNIVWLCKGFEYDTGLLPHQVVAEVLGDAVPGAALSGPSFAQEVARGLPCALTVASASAALRERVVGLVHGGNMRVYACDDLVGVEVGGAVKNILAIATGAADGLGLGLNARAALITRGLAEITRLGTALGGQAGTFMGLTGMGDLILTCTGDLSRNRRVGLALAEGKQLDTIVRELGHVAEGVPCAKAVRELARKMGVDMPITNAVAGVLFDGIPAAEMAGQLLARDPRNELA
jgi:glycerol-3-phosphate dehydrogenase (NAD(P)+)